jgi:formylglycine-generating enzyme required for sulfatase activity
MLRRQLTPLGILFCLFSLSVVFAQPGRGADDKAAGTVITNSLGMKFAYSPAGTFQMGSTKYSNNAKPVHTVIIGRGFYMGRTEVTQGEWEKVMGTTLRQQQDKYFVLSGEGADYPMYYVSWEEAKEYIRRLNDRNDGYIYSLPTEAEWEYAARAGTTGDYAGDLDSMAWYDKNSGYTSHPVGQKSPNAFGLYDMHGNVMEWCEDIYNDKGYAGLPTDGSANMSVGNKNLRVLRGGSFGLNANSARSAFRGGAAQSHRNGLVGFRVVARVR